MGKVKASHLAIFAVSLAVPTSAYAFLVNRRLERRLPLVTKNQLPDHIEKSVSVPGKPATNYVEAFYADLPANKFSKDGTLTNVEDVARTFFTTLPMRAEWKILSFLNAIGFNLSEDTSDPEAKGNAPFTKGKSIMDGAFTVVKGVEEKDAREIQISYWFKKKSSLPDIWGGVHSLVCEPLDKRTIRVWFVTYMALKDPSVELVADDNSRVTPWSWLVGYDPRIVEAKNHTSDYLSSGFWPQLWFHRFYSRILLDFTSRSISMRK